MSVRRPVAVTLMTATVALVMLWAPAASAHALLKSSDPADGADLVRAPHQILMTFTEPPDPSLSLAQVLDSTGHPVTGASKVQPVTGNPDQLRVVLATTLPGGVYTVNWRTVSKTDGHVTGGAFAFGIGVAPSAATAASPGSGAGAGPPTLAVVGRWAYVWGLVVLVGAAATGLFVFEGRLPRGASLTLAAGFTLAVAGIAMETLVERAQIGISVGSFLSSSVGTSFARQGVALLLVGAAAAAVVLRPKRATLWSLGAAGALAMLTHALAGHADAPSSTRILNLLDEWVHITAVGVWIGGLVWLLLGLRAGERSEHRTLAVRFSLMATIAVVVVVLSGLGRAVQELGSIGNLFDTSFGITLLVKVGIFVVLGGIAVVNRFRIVPGIRAGTKQAGTLRRTVSAEVVLAVGVVAVAVLLSEIPPASYAAAVQKAPAQSASVVRGSDFATTVRVTLTVAPGTVGLNTFSARVVNFDTGAPLTARSVRLQFSLPAQPTLGSSTLALARASGGVWRGTGAQLSIEGRWDVDVVVQEAANAVDVPLKLRTRLPPERITTSAVAGQPTLYTIQLGGGRTLQTYTETQKAGPNTVHFTFFTGSGSEQPIASATAAAITPSGADRPLHLIRFSAGHFAANADLSAGHWTFSIDGRTADGTLLSGYFTQQIGS